MAFPWSRSQLRRPSAGPAVNRRRFPAARACLTALAAVYAPVGVAGLALCFGSGCDHCCKTWVTFWPLFPGLLPTEFARSHGAPFLNGPTGLACAAASTLLLFAAAVAGASLRGRGRWIALSTVAAWSAFTAAMAYALIRA